MKVHFASWFLTFMYVHFVHLHCYGWMKSLNEIGSVFLPYIMKMPINSHNDYHSLSCHVWFTHRWLPMKYLFSSSYFYVEYIYILLWVWRFALNQEVETKANGDKGSRHLLSKGGWKGLCGDCFYLWPTSIKWFVSVS
jgi:hypothetical protein